MRELKHRELAWITDVNWPGSIRTSRHHANHGLDKVVNIAEAARLLSIAVDGYIFAAQRLHDEVAYDSPVLWIHARAVGVKDAHNLDGHFVLSVVVEEQRFRAAFALVVATAGPYRIDIAPIAFGLRVDSRVAVNFARRGLQDFGTDTLGESEHVDGAYHEPWSSG